MGKQSPRSKNRQKQKQIEKLKLKQQREKLEQNFVNSTKTHFTVPANRPAFIPFIEQLVTLRNDPALNPTYIQLEIEEVNESAPLNAKAKKQKALPALTATRALIENVERDNIDIPNEVLKEICELLSHPQFLAHLTAKNITQENAQAPESWANYFKRNGTRFFTRALLAAAIPISGWLFYNLSGSTSETVEQESLVVESLEFINFVYVQTIQANSFFLASIIVEEVENLILKTRQFSITHSTLETIGYFAANLVKIGIAGVANYYVFSLGFQQLIDPDRPDLEKLLGLTSANIQTFSTANFLVNYFPSLIISYIKNRDWSKANKEGLAEAAPQPEEHFDWADINQQLADFQNPDKVSNSTKDYNPNLGLLLFSKQWENAEQEKLSKFAVKNLPQVKTAANSDTNSLPKHYFIAISTMSGLGLVPANILGILKEPVWATFGLLGTLGTMFFFSYRFVYGKDSTKEPKEIIKAWCSSAVGSIRGFATAVIQITWIFSFLSMWSACLKMFKELGLDGHTNDLHKMVTVTITAISCSFTAIGNIVVGMGAVDKAFDLLEVSLKKITQCGQSAESPAAKIKKIEQIFKDHTEKMNNLILTEKAQAEKAAAPGPDYGLPLFSCC